MKDITSSKKEILSHTVELNKYQASILILCYDSAIHFQQNLQTMFLTLILRLVILELE